MKDDTPGETLIERRARGVCLTCGINPVAIDDFSGDPDSLCLDCRNSRAADESPAPTAAQPSLFA